MKGTMKAARIHALGEPLRVEEVPIPDIGKGEVLIRVLRAGLAWARTPSTLACTRLLARPTTSRVASIAACPALRFASITLRTVSRPSRWLSVSSSRNCRVSSRARPWASVTERTVAE